jgi:hypothetical protein
MTVFSEIPGQILKKTVITLRALRFKLKYLNQTCISLKSSMQLVRTIFSDSAIFNEKKRVENRLWPKKEFLWPKTKYIICTVCASGQYNSSCVGVSSGSCQTCSTCPPPSFRIGCGGVNAGSCASLCKVCSSDQYQVGCNGTYNGTCIPCLSCLPGKHLLKLQLTGVTISWRLMEFDSSSGQYSFGCGGNYSGQCILCEPVKFRESQGPFNSSECQNCEPGTVRWNQSSWSMTQNHTMQLFELLMRFAMV